MLSLEELGNSLLAGIEELREEVSSRDDRRFALRVRSVSLSAVFLAEGGAAATVEIGSPERPVPKPEAVGVLQGLTQPVHVEARRLRESAPESVGRLRLNLRFE